MSIVFDLSFILQSKVLSFWRDWSPGMQRRFALMFVILVGLTGLLAWTGLHEATRRAGEEASRALERHLRVAGMAQEIRMLERGTGEALAEMPILVAARQVSREIGLEEKLTSVRPALQSAGREGVQLYYERLDLGELVGLLEVMYRDAGLQTSSLTLNRRLDNPGRADLQLVLFR
ncbi:MAG TPA: hypothetical protein ENN39_07245 [Desulfonatronum sp.]|nr:hypothetical protein [Desulfonatronum sp.]